MITLTSGWKTIAATPAFVAFARHFRGVFSS
jgi:hypothetical protein